MKVLVTGAGGALGPTVVQALLGAGHQVRACSREVKHLDSLPPAVERCGGDVTDKRAVAAWMQGVDAVVHLAALLHVNHPPAALLRRYQAINIGGTENLVRGAIDHSVKRLVLASTIAVYGEGDGGVLDEDSRPRPDTPYAESKLAAEGIVLEARGKDGRPFGCVLRLGAVYGPTMKGNYLRLTRALARGRFVPIGAGGNRRTLVHAEDVAQAVGLALSEPAAAGRCYNVADGCFPPVKEIITAISEALGRRPPRFSLPVSWVRPALHCLAAGARLFGRDPLIAPATLDKYTMDIAVRADRIRSELGFSPKYDLKTGWRKTIRDMRRMGRL